VAGRRGLGKTKCADCGKLVRDLTYGHCGRCYEAWVKEYGELALLVSTYSAAPVKYIFKVFDTVYVHFYRTKRGKPLTHERQWCAEFRYVDGYPCPPTIRFVNPYNYADDNPVWWPPTKFHSDPLNQTLDLECVSARTSVTGNTPSVSLEDAGDRWSPHILAKTLAANIKEKRF
jgi:hypothetical protein